MSIKANNVKEVLSKNILADGFDPIIDLKIQSKIGPALSYFSSFENHVMHGRNAEFKYVHTHDLLKNSEKIVEKFIAEFK